MCRQGRQIENSFGWMGKATKARAGAGYSPQKGTSASQDESAKKNKKNTESVALNWTNKCPLILDVIYFNKNQP